MAIGKHGGKSRIKKIVNLLGRSSQLMRSVRKSDVSLAVSHGSRTQVLAAWRLGIPSVVMLDYEFTESRLFNTLATRLLIPSMIPDDRLKEAGFNLKKVIRYNAFKEQLYLGGFVPEPGFRQILGVDKDTILVTVRPPSMTGNYHDRRSEALFDECLTHFGSFSGVHVLIVNRTAAERALVPESVRHKVNISTLQKPVDGLQLLWHSDLVVSGGGTMNRESVLLGVPTFSIFSGKKPFLDELLQGQGKLNFLETFDEIRSLVPKKRVVRERYDAPHTEVVREVTDALLACGRL